MARRPSRPPRPRRRARPSGGLAFAEISSTDPVATQRFLRRVFGWTFTSVRYPMGTYRSFRTSDGGQGGVRPARSGEAPGSLNYVLVRDLDASRLRIERAGGEIVLPRVDIPEMGSFFWFRLPGGPILACWQDAPPRRGG